MADTQNLRQFGGSSVSSSTRWADIPRTPVKLPRGVQRLQIRNFHWQQIQPITSHNLVTPEVSRAGMIRSDYRSDDGINR